MGDVTESFLHVDKLTKTLRSCADDGLVTVDAFGRGRKVKGNVSKGLVVDEMGIVHSECGERTGLQEDRVFPGTCN